jgi:hypothetical protein
MKKQCTTSARTIAKINCNSERLLQRWSYDTEKVYLDGEYQGKIIKTTDKEITFIQESENRYMNGMKRTLIFSKPYKD